MRQVDRGRRARVYILEMAFLKNEDWINKTETALSNGEKILAAGQFGLSDDYKKITAGAVGASLLIPGDNALVSGLSAGAVVGGSRALNAEEQGVSQEMLVAVSSENIYIFSLRALGGGDPKDQLFCFPRAETDVEIKRFGLCRHLNIHDRETEKVLKLTGTTLKVAPSANGDRAVLAELAS